MNQVFLINPFLHPDLVIGLDADRPIVEDVLTLTESFQLRGGAGAYTAAAMIRCGLGVAPVDRVGSDIFGEFTVRQLRDLGCDVSRIGRYDGDHFLVVSLADQTSHGGTMISCRPPAWIEPAADIVERISWLPDGGTFYLWSWFWSYANPEVAKIDTTDLVGMIRQKADLLVLDPNWKPDGAPPASEVAGFHAVADHLDVLKLNRRDAAVLVGDLEPRDTVTALLAAGPKVVVLTLGGEGCLLGTANSGQVFQLPAVDTAVKDTTGAGDSFGGAFVARYLEDGDALRAAAQAAAIASHVVAGTPASSISDDEIQRLSTMVLEGSKPL